MEVYSDEHHDVLREKTSRCIYKPVNSDSKDCSQRLWLYSCTRKQEKAKQVPLIVTSHCVAVLRPSTPSAGCSAQNYTWLCCQRENETITTKENHFLSVDLDVYDAVPKTKRRILELFLVYRQQVSEIQCESDCYSRATNMLTHMQSDRKHPEARPVKSTVASFSTDRLLVFDKRPKWGWEASRHHLYHYLLSGQQPQLQRLSLLRVGRRLASYTTSPAAPLVLGKILLCGVNLSKENHCKLCHAL